MFISRSDPLLQNCTIVHVLFYTCKSVYIMLLARSYLTFLNSIYKDVHTPALHKIALEKRDLEVYNPPVTKCKLSHSRLERMCIHCCPFLRLHECSANTRVPYRHEYLTNTSTRVLDKYLYSYSAVAAKVREYY